MFHSGGLFKFTPQVHPKSEECSEGTMVLYFLEERAFPPSNGTTILYLAKFAPSSIIPKQIRSCSSARLAQSVIFS